MLYQMQVTLPHMKDFCPPTRNLQARVLREEWERREELELLQEEQRRMLEEETKKRQAFEAEQEEKDRQLRGKMTIQGMMIMQPVSTAKLLLGRLNVIGTSKH